MDKVASLNKLPAKCQECAKSQAPRFHRGCHFCRELEFQESVLCDLNRDVQDISVFQCHAFEPRLKLVSLPENNVTDRLDRPSKRQKLGRDPEGIYVQLKYHLAWNVRHRMSVFNPINDFISFAHDTFLLCSEKVNGFVELLYLAPDHVHLYIESDGELSVEEMVHRIKQFSNNAILDKYSFLREKLVKDTEIWDEAYFVETAG